MTDEQLIRAAFNRISLDDLYERWAIARRPVTTAVHRPMPSRAFYLRTEAPSELVPMEHVVFHYEQTHYPDGTLTERIIGTMPGTETRVIVYEITA